MLHLDAPCGAQGQRCCNAYDTDIPQCAQGTECASDFTCQPVPCGNVGQDCCAPGVPVNGCFGFSTCVERRCKECGLAVGEACCPSGNDQICSWGKALECSAGTCAAAWPKTYAPTSMDHVYPDDYDDDWTDGLQGVAHTTDSWFFTYTWATTSSLGTSNAFGVLTAARTTPLESSGIDWIVGLSGAIHDPSIGVEWNHLGDPDVWHSASNTWLVIPVENDPHEHPGVWLIGLDWPFMALRVLPTPGPRREAPWIARNPVDGLWYTSDFNISDTDPIRAYDIAATRDTQGNFGIDVTYVKSIPGIRTMNGATLPLDGIQGGAFSGVGHLYLNTMSSGIVGIDLGDRRAHAWIGPDYDTNKFEAEGIDLFDIQTVSPPTPRISGRIHNIYIESHWYRSDDFYFEHWTTPVASEAWKL